MAALDRNNRRASGSVSSTFAVAGFDVLLSETRWLPFATRVAQKLSLIKIYSSQFPSLPQSIEQFSPAADVLDGPHEAIWSCEKMPIE